MKEKKKKVFLDNYQFLHTHTHTKTTLMSGCLKNTSITKVERVGVSVHLQSTECVIHYRAITANVFRTQEIITVTIKNCVLQ